MRRERGKEVNKECKMMRPRRRRDTATNERSKGGGRREERGKGKEETEERGRGRRKR